MSPQIVRPSSFRTRYDLVGNEARASQAPSYSTRYCLVGNEARASQAPSYNTRYDLVSNEAHTFQNQQSPIRVSSGLAKVICEALEQRIAFLQIAQSEQAKLGNACSGGVRRQWVFRKAQRWKNG
ncbi:hypothetical protein MMC31_000504 [Peltigera leucophlebia]|nr:hypothetical protein [Peltigera leucophlebia]